MTSFLNFPDKSEVLERLAEVEDLTLQTQQLFDAIGSRIASRVFDCAGFTFVLMELIREHELAWGRDLGALLPRAVIALTGDRELAHSAQRAFEEIKGVSEG